MSKTFSEKLRDYKKSYIDSGIIKLSDKWANDNWNKLVKEKKFLNILGMNEYKRETIKEANKNLEKFKRNILSREISDVYYKARSLGFNEPKNKSNSYTYLKFLKNKIDEILNRESEEASRLGDIDISDVPDSGNINFTNTEASHLNGYHTIIKFKTDKNIHDDVVYFNLAQHEYVRALKKQIAKHRGVKYILSWEVEFKKLIVDENDEEKYIYTNPNAFFNANPSVLTTLNEEDIKVSLRDAYATIHTRIDEFINNGSGWSISVIKKSDINISKYTPLRGRSYIKLDPLYSNTKGFVNIENKDNECFKWSILAGLYYNDVPEKLKKKRSRVSTWKPYEKELDFTGIEFPIKADSKILKQFTKKNNISVNVYEGKIKTVNGESLKDPYPIYISDDILEKHVDLLVISEHDKESDSDRYHYVLISNFDRGFGQVVQKGNHSITFCKRCLAHFYDKQKRDDHFESKVCFDYEAVRTILPKEGANIVEFKNHVNKFQVPVHIEADFECTLKPIIDIRDGVSMPKTYEHEINSFAYKICSKYPELDKQLVVYRGVDAAKQFLDRILVEKDELLKKLQKYKKIEDMKITKNQIEEFHKATHCHICEKLFSKNSKNDKNDKQKKVRDHCHITGDYIGAAHSDCNLKRTNRDIPVIFHNLKGYDGNIIIKALNKNINNIRVIPHTKEKFMSFSFCNLKFIDSMNFLQTSLSKLVDTLTAKPEENHLNFKNVFNHFRDYPREKINLLLRKGIYPYEWVDSEEKFKFPTLPPKGAFYSSLTLESVSDIDYAHAQKVFIAFNCKNFEDYHKLYLTLDVLQLSDIMENMVDNGLSLYKLDPLHYVSLPGYSWDSALKYSKVRQETFTDEQLDMYLMIEANLRGGMSTITNRFAKGNNKYMNDFDEKQDSSYNIYLDANNLYGHSMSQPLPVGGYKWDNPEEFTTAYIRTLRDEDKRGYIIECDLEYPTHLHDLHNDYPLAPEKVLPSPDMISDYNKRQIELLKDNKYTPTTKLIANLNDKIKYVVHYSNLKYYLSQGLILKRVHRVLSFNQQPWLKDYIQLNTRERAKTKNSFKREFYKLMNNAVFGKTMENVRNHMN